MNTKSNNCNPGRKVDKMSDCSPLLYLEVREDLGNLSGGRAFELGFHGVVRSSPDGERGKISCYIYFLVAFALSQTLLGRTPLKFQFLEFLLLICDACGGGFWGEDLEEIVVLLAGLCPQEVKMF